MHLPPQLHLVLAARRAATAAHRPAAGRRRGRPDRRAGPRDRRRRHRRARRRPASAPSTPSRRRPAGWPLAVQLAAELGGAADRSTTTRSSIACSTAMRVLFEYLAEEVMANASDAERELLALAAHVPFVDAAAAHLARPRRRSSRCWRRSGATACSSSATRRRPTATGPRSSAASSPAGHSRRRPTSSCAASSRSLCERGEAEEALETCLRLGDAGAGPRGRARRRATGPARRARWTTPSRSPAAAGDDTRLAELRGDLHYLRGSWDDAVAAYAEAARLGDPTPPAWRGSGRRCSTCGAASTRPTPRARPPASTARDPAEESKVLSWRAAIRWMRGDVDGLPHGSSSRPLAVGTAAGDDAALATAHTTRAMLAALRRRPSRERRRLPRRPAPRPAGRRRRADRAHPHEPRQPPHGGGQLRRRPSRELDAAIELAELIGSDNFGALAYSNRGDTYRRLGRLDDALDDLRRAEAIWQRLGSGLVHYAVGLLGDVQALRGQRSEAIALYRQAIELADAQGDTQALVPGLIGLARTLVADDPDAAMEAAERAIGTARSMSMAARPPRRRLDRAAPRRPRRRGQARPPRRCSSGRPTRTARPSPRRCCSRRRSASLPTSRSPRSRGASAATSATASARPAPRWPSPARSTRRRATTPSPPPSSCSSRPAHGACSPRPASRARRPETARRLDRDARRVPRQPAPADRSRSASGARARPATCSSCSSPGAARRSCARRSRRCCGPTSPTDRRAGSRCC